MSVLENYQAADLELKTEVVRIVNFLSDWCEDPKWDFCDFEIDELYLDTSASELVVYPWGRLMIWGIPEIYLSMPDEEILAHAKADYYARYKASEDSQVERIRKDALLYGYKLVKLEG